MIYVIVGPTASGKSRAAEMLYKKCKDAVLINADAFQIYKDMDVATAKISKDDPLRSQYKLLDVVTPDKTFSVKEYQELARKEIDKALDKNKDVIMVGGTGLYIRATLYDYDFPETQDSDVSEYNSLNNEDLHGILKSLDPKEAEKIHPNNRKRVIRAIELIKMSGESKSDILSKQKHKIIYDNVKIYFINPPRDELYERINNRVDEMFESGLIDETKMLLEKYELSLTSKQAIGYCETIDLIYNKSSIDDAKNKIKQRTRNYAKRQVTFFKHQFNTIEVKNFDEILVGDIK